jgi:hypothetical protein
MVFKDYIFSLAVLLGLGTGLLTLFRLRGQGFHSRLLSLLVTLFRPLLVAGSAIHVFCVMGPDALCCVRLDGFLPLLVRLLGEDASGLVLQKLL